MRGHDRYNVVVVNGKRVLEHVAVWEKANGPKPKGCDIHHKNGIGRDNRLENLVCLTKSEHKLLHAKLKLEGKDVIDENDPGVIKSRQQSNANAKAHRKAHLEEERARDRIEYKNNREHKRELQKANYQRHRESMRASQAVYESEHKEERAARNAAYHDAHAEERKVYLKKYRAEHKEERAEKQRKYNAEHQDQLQEYRSSRRQVHTMEARLYSAIKRGASEEVINKLKDDVQQARETFKQKRIAEGKKVR